jgi:hypothetical protein
LPSAPPRISASAALYHALPPRLSRTRSTAVATTAIVTKNQRCQPDAAERKLNAAPVLNVSTRLKKGVTAKPSPSRIVASIAAFVA